MATKHRFSAAIFCIDPSKFWSPIFFSAIAFCTHHNSRVATYPLLPTTLLAAHAGTCIQKIVRFGADGRSQLVSVNAQQTVRVWDLGTGLDSTAMRPKGGSKSVAAKAARDFLPDLDAKGKKHQALPLVARQVLI